MLIHPAREQVAYSLDGVNWESGVGNPVLQHGRLAGPVSAMAEIHMHYVSVGPLTKCRILHAIHYIVHKMTL